MSSYAITVRPKNGLHNEYDEAIIKYIKHFTYSCYVHEMEDEARHLHAQIWIPKRDINNIRKALYRIAEKHDPDWGPASRKVLSSGVKYCYNDDFYTKYMTKDLPEPIFSMLPYYNIPENTLEYYPNEEEQAEAKKKAKRVADAYFNHLQEMWEELNPDYEEFHPIKQLKDISMFYYDQMFISKTIAVIRDARQRKQNAKCLYNYVFKPKDLDMVMTDADIELYRQFDPIDEE